MAGLKNPAAVLGRADTTLKTVDVRGLLTDLRDQLALLEQVPGIVEKLEEIHAAVTTT